MTKKKKSNKKNVSLIIIGLIIVILLAVFATYVFWNHNFRREEGSKELSVGCLGISFTLNTDYVNLVNAHPVTESVGKNTKPYSFIVTNNCDKRTNFVVYLETLIGSSLEDKYINAVLNDGEVVNLSSYPLGMKVLDNSIDAHILTQGFIKENGKVSFDLRLWIPNNIEEELIKDKEYVGKITVSDKIGE